MSDPAGSYDAGSIRVLAGLEPIRMRPAMYIGATDTDGIHHLVFEVVENAIDEALAGYCTRVLVTLRPDGSAEVEDDGRGIPVEDHPLLGRPAIELVMTTLHAGGKFGSGSYPVSGGLHGVGVSCVNALSSSLEVEVWRGGRRWQMGFARGDITAPLADTGPTERRGTRLRFTPDDQIFSGDRVIDREVVARRLQELAFLHPGVAIRLEDERDGTAETYQYEDGILGFVAHLNRHRTALHPQPIHLQHAADGVQIELAMQWTTSYAEDISTYVNSIHTAQGGTHLEGLKRALTRVVHSYGVGHKLLDESLGEEIAGYDVREGLTAVLSVKMPDPEFASQTKSRLSTPELLGLVEGLVIERFGALLEEDAALAAIVVGKAIEASRARMAARRASERAQYVSVDQVASKEVYKKQFGIRSKNWHASAAWIANDELLGKHAAMTEMPPDAKVLDACCGSGVVGNAFRGRVGHITGLDITPEMVALAKTRLDEVVHGDVYDIPFEDETFDMVVNREVLHLLPRPEKPVGEIFRVLKPGGQFVVGQILPFSRVDAPWMFRVFKKKQPLIFNMFQEQDFRALIEGAGFVNVTMTEHLLWESIDVWIDTHETTSLHRQEIRHLFYSAPEEVREVHPFKVHPDGRIDDCWRWCIFSGFKPA
jgi:DNA gyrase subunit B